MQKRKMSFFQLGTLILFFSIACGLDFPGTYDSLQVGSIAPDFSLSSTSDATVTLSTFRGKIVMVNFWASWCGPCRAEMPDVQRVSSKYAGDLIVLGVNDEDTLSTIRDFAQQFELTFPLLIDSTGNVSAQYKIRAYPTTFFVDREGYIFHIAVGSMEQSMIEEVLREKISLQTASDQENAQPSQPPAPGSSVEGCVTAGALNVRIAPSRDSEIVDWVYRDECYLFEARSSDSGWLKLGSTWQGKGQWVSAKYITLKASIDNLPVSE